MKLLTTILFVAFGLKGLAQTTVTRNWIHTQETYYDPLGNSINVTNSLPKGGANYTTVVGQTYSYVIFWYGVTNISEVPMKLTMTFPLEPLSFFPSSDSHIRLFFPPETMTSEKIDLFDYGVTNLKGFLDTRFYEPSSLEKTINPKEEFLFYVAVLMYQAQGSARASLVMKDNELLYQINIGLETAIIPCGPITFKD